MAKTAPTKGNKHPVEAAPAAPLPVLAPPANVEVPHIDTHRAKRAIPRDAAIMIALHTTLDQAVHLHDPIEPHEADRIFSFAVKGLADQMLLPILTSAQDVLEGGDLCFQRDSQPIAASSDRHASKLVRKRLKRRKQSYVTAVKTSIYGNYAASRTSSRTESRFGGSKFGGSRASASLWGSVSKVPRMSLIYDLHRAGESLMNSSWIGSQQGSTGTASNNASWLPGAFSTTTSLSPPPSVAGTARVAVDFVELQRRADIERDLNTRESVRRSKDEFNRKSDLRLKLRSLADPTVSLDKEEARMTAFGARGSRSRLQRSRQGTRDGKRVGSSKSSKSSTLATDETTTFRTEDYEGLTSDVVLCSKSGELLVGENCFVVEQKHRRELLLDLQTRGVVQPRIQLVATPKPDEDIVPDENVPSPGPQQPTRSSPPPLRPPGAPTSAEQLQISTPSDFDGQIGFFESSPCLALDLEATPLAKGVILKLPDTGAARALATKTRNAPTKKSPKRAPLPESVSNAKLENHLSALIQAPDASQLALSTSQSDSVLQTQRALPTAAPLSTSPASVQPPQTTKPSGAGSPVLPKHIHNGEKHLQSLRIRTPAYPTRLSRKTPSHGSLFVDRDEYEWAIEGAESLFSLQEQSSTNSLPTVKYVREFPKPPQGRVQVFGAVPQNADWKLPSPSPFSFHPRTTTVQHKGR